MELCIQTSLSGFGSYVKRPLHLGHFGLVWHATERVQSKLSAFSGGKYPPLVGGQRSIFEFC
jgi:hypothetical protein